MNAACDYDYDPFGPLPPITDPWAVADFIDHLYGSVERGVLALNRLTDHMETAWFGFDDRAAMAARASSLEPGRGVYVSIATRRVALPKGRGRADDCLDVVAFAVDIDVAGPPHAATSLPPTFEDARLLLNDMRVQPTCVVNTGHGLQAFWLLDEPVPVHEADEVMRRWGITWKVLAGRRGWSVDNTSTCEHVFRLPGTVNTKVAGEPKPVHITERHWQRVYSLDDVDEATVDEPTPSRAPRSLSSGNPLGAQPPWHWYNERHDVEGLLVAFGCAYSHTSRGDGRRQFFAPHHAEARDQTGITIYDDEDGEHAVIWSGGFAQQLGVEQRQSLDAFDLFTRLHHGGVVAAAVRAVEAERAVTGPSVGAGGTPGVEDAEDERAALAAAAMRSRILTVAQLRTLPPPRSLVTGLLDLDSLVFLYGPRASYKSFIALDLASAIATGTRWHDRQVTEGSVLIVAAEGHGGLNQRFDAWERAHLNHIIGDRLHVLPEAVNLMNPSSVATVIEAASDYMTNLVVLDTVARCMLGGDENSSRDAGLAIEQLDVIRRATGACVMGVHHSGKNLDAGARGSSAIEAAADTVLQVTASDTKVTITTTKQKNHVAAAPILLTARPVGSSVVLDRYDGSDLTASDTGMQALRALIAIDLPEGVTSADWKAQSGLSRPTFDRRRADLVHRGLASLVGGSARGRYQATEAGKAHASLTPHDAS